MASWRDTQNGIGLQVKSSLHYSFVTSAGESRLKRGAKVIIVFVNYEFSTER